MKFNERQMEGLARISDNLATSIIVAIVLSLTGYQFVPFQELFGLILLLPLVIWYGYLLRRRL